MTEYQLRNETLKEMGFSSYRDYLGSEIWALTRKKVLLRARRVCCSCGKRAEEVHHSSYSRDVLLGKDLSKLHAVCAACHVGAEIASDGKKRSLAEANAILRIGFKKSEEDVCVGFSEECVKEIARSRVILKQKKGRSFCSCGNFKKHNRPKCRKCQPDHTGSVATKEDRRKKHLGKKSPIARKPVEFHPASLAAVNASRLNRAMELICSNRRKSKVKSKFR